MELITVLRVLLRRWWLILIPVIITAVITVPEILQTPPTTYSVTIRYNAMQANDAQLPPRDGDYQDVWLAAGHTVNALTDWVRTTSFSYEVIDKANQLGLNLDRATPLPIAADNNERGIGVLTISWGDSAQLETLIQAAVEVLRTRAVDYFPQLGQRPAQVSILDTPVVTAAPPSLVDRFRPLIKVALGLAVGLGLAFLAEYLDPVLRRREELESLGIPVLGALPRR